MEINLGKIQIPSENVIILLALNYYNLAFGHLKVARIKHNN